MAKNNKNNKANLTKHDAPVGVLDHNTEDANYDQKLEDGTVIHHEETSKPLQVNEVHETHHEMIDGHDVEVETVEIVTTEVKRIIHEVIPPSPPPEKVKSEAKIVSNNGLPPNGTIVAGPYGQEEIKYVEVPVIQEVIKKVIKKETIHVERRVPIVNYEYVDKVVEIPQINYVDKLVEVPQVQEQVVRVPIIEYVEVPREVIRTVPKVTVKKVEKSIDVPGDIIEVEKKYTVENKIVVPKYEKVDVVTIVAQRLHPFIFEDASMAAMEVKVAEWSAALVEVEIFLPRPIARTMVAGKMESVHKLVEVTAAQWNSLVFNCNQHVRDENDLKDILICSGDMVPTVQGPGTTIVHPICDIDSLLSGVAKFKIHVSEDDKNAALVEISERPNYGGQSNTLQRSVVAEEIARMAAMAHSPSHMNQGLGSSSFFSSSPLNFGSSGHSMSAMTMSATSQRITMEEYQKIKK